MKIPTVIETFEIDGVIEVICAASDDVASTAWICFAAARRSSLGTDKITSMNACLSYTTRDVRYEWKIYVLEEL